MVNIKEFLNKKILILDGAMGTMIQNQGLDESDYRGVRFKNWNIDLKGNNELLTLTKPDVIEFVHEEYLKAGADIIECNTFNSNSISQRNYGLENYIDEMNRASVRLAKKVCKKYSTPQKPRFVAGSIGPCKKSLSIASDPEHPESRDITFDELVSSYEEQITVLAEENVDVFILETIFDTLNAKAGIYAINKVLKKQNKYIPTIISATLTDKSGRTLSGQTLEAFYYSIEHAKPIAVGLNCSMGIDNMIPYIEILSKIADCGISVYANAGLPNEFGEYLETPENMVKGYEYLAKNGLINIAGGCCGTTPKHIQKFSEVLTKYKPKKIEPKPRTFTPFCGLETFIYDGRQNFIMVGERTSVTGSKKFADLIREKKFNQAVEIAKKQVLNGANIINISMDSDLSDAKSDMVTFLNYISTEPEISRVPIMIDSSDFDVIFAGLKCVQTKPIVNSISLKNGEQEFIYQANLIKEFGGQVVVMAFDEKSQATGVNDRIEIITRAYNILTNVCNYDPTDIIFDLNIFPVATGIPEHNNNAVNFIEALKILKQKFPHSMFSGGISNISFSFRGINIVREAMHTIFLYHAIRAGLTMGIVNPGMLMRYNEIEEPLKTLVENVILNKSDNASDKLLNYVQNGEWKKLTNNSLNDKPINKKWRSDTVDKRIQHALIQGDISYITQDLKEALKQYSPVYIIEHILLEGMNKVGQDFAAGKMFLPQVVKSSRIMKEIVNTLEQEFEIKSDSKKNGTIVLATVKGDVHDIGKNILSLMLTCNNFKVIDLGVMVNCSDILHSAKEYNADIIGLSGLITPSLDEMQKVATELEKEGFKLPTLMVGGATTSKKHTALKIAPKYNGLVVHTTNASEAVVVAQKIISKDNDFISQIKQEQSDIRSNYK